MKLRRVLAGLAAMAAGAVASAASADWFEPRDIDRMAHDFRRLKFPAPYPDVLAIVGDTAVQQRLRMHTGLSPGATSDGTFTTRIVLTDPAAGQGCQLLELHGSTQDGTAPQNRLVHAITVRLYQPRGRVTGPLAAEGGYRQFVLRRPGPPPTAPPGKTIVAVKDGVIMTGPDKGTPVIFGGTVGTTKAAGGPPPVYRWLEPAALDRIERQLRTLKLPVTLKEAMKLLSPSDGERQLPRSVRMSDGRLDSMRVEVPVDFTDRASPAGYYSLLMSGDGFSPNTSRDAWRIEQIALNYHMPVAPVTARRSTQGGYRSFELDLAASQ